MKSITLLSLLAIVHLSCTKKQLSAADIKKISGDCFSKIHVDKVKGDEVGQIIYTGSKECAPHYDEYSSFYEHKEVTVVKGYSKKEKTRAKLLKNSGLKHKSKIFIEGTIAYVKYKGKVTPVGTYMREGPTFKFFHSDKAKFELFAKKDSKTFKSWRPGMSGEPVFAVFIR